MKELNERELLLLAYLEGELTGAEKEKAEALLAEDAMMEFEYKQFQKTKLVPETATVYPNKSKLKRHTMAGAGFAEKAKKKEKISLGYMLWPAAIAASFALIILFYSPQHTTTTGGVATTTTPADKNNPVVSPSTETNVLPPNQHVASTSSSKTGTEQKTPAHHKGVEQKTVTENEVNDGEQTNKTLLAAAALAPIPFAAPQVTLPQPSPIMQPEITLPELGNTGTPNDDTRNGWFAKTGDKINHLMSYLKKPKVNFDKQEDEQGKDYWTITLETDKYEWEGKLFTSR